jgi:hypothetical protein
MVLAARLALAADNNPALPMAAKLSTKSADPRTAPSQLKGVSDEEKHCLRARQRPLQLAQMCLGMLKEQCRAISIRLEEPGALARALEVAAKDN